MIDARLVYSTAHHEAPGGRPVLKAYQDPKGIWTIGLGTNLQVLVIDEALARSWHLKALEAAQNFARVRYPWFDTLSTERQNAVVELIYQLGPEGFHAFKNMRAAIEAGDFERAAVELLDSKYHRVDMANSPRDEWLAELLRTGTYTTPSAY